MHLMPYGAISVGIVIRDLRFALRALLASPTFALAAIITLALGIGASTAGFSLANWLLFRPLPGVRNGDRLAVIWFGSRQCWRITAAPSSQTS